MESYEPYKGYGITYSNYEQIIYLDLNGIQFDCFKVKNEKKGINKSKKIINSIINKNDSANRFR